MSDFSSTQKFIEAQSKKYFGLTTELRQIQTEIAATIGATTNRKDVCELAVNWVEIAKARFAPALANRMRNSFTQGETSPYEFGFFAAMEAQSRGLTAGAMDEAMCAVFGTEIKITLIDAINKMDWPNEGLPRVERAARVEKLRAHEKEILAEIAALIKQADEAGFELA